MTNSAGSEPFWVVAIDINGDGMIDLVVADGTASNLSVLFGDGTGFFEPGESIGVGSGPYGVAVGDLNGDGYADLVAANHIDNNLRVLLGQ